MLLSNQKVFAQGKINKRKTFTTFPNNNSLKIITVQPYEVLQERPPTLSLRKVNLYRAALDEIKCHLCDDWHKCLYL